jgi:hypothetical protein
MVVRKSIRADWAIEAVLNTTEIGAVEKSGASTIT